MSSGRNMQSIGTKRKKRGIRFYFAQISAKLFYFMLRLIGRDGGSLPGFLALKIDHHYLRHVDRPGTVIGITGTNGKSTVTNLTADYLKKMGRSCISNSNGTNILSGQAAVFVKYASFTGRLRCEYAVLEMDERYAPYIFKDLQPDILAVTNLFRDSYARNAHVEFIFNILNGCIPEKTELVLNSDDLISSALGGKNKKSYISIPLQEAEIEERNSRTRDLVNCPECGKKLSPVFVRYHHIGRYVCPNCGFKNREPDYSMDKIDTAGKTAEIFTKSEKNQFALPTSNFVDAYNTLTAVCILNRLGFGLDLLGAASRNIKVIESRNHEIKINGKTLLTLYAKGHNPVASSRSFDYIRKLPGKKSVVILNTALSEKEYENIGWIYDNDVQYLKDSGVAQIICPGPRAYDVKLALQIAGIEENIISTPDRIEDAAARIDVADSDYIVLLRGLQVGQRKVKARETKMIKELEGILESGGKAPGDGADSYAC